MFCFSSEVAAAMNCFQGLFLLHQLPCGLVLLLPLDWNFPPLKQTNTSFKSQRLLGLVNYDPVVGAGLEWTELTPFYSHHSIFVLLKMYGQTLLQIMHWTCLLCE